MLRKNIFLLFFLCVFIYNNTNRPNRLDWDVFGYYLYLPAQFIYHDIHLENKEKWLNPLIDKYKTTDAFYQAYKGPEGKYVMKYTMGLSFVYAPFFFIADMVAPWFGYERDGFSAPYQWMLMFCALLFSLTGIYYLYKILNIYFNETITFAAVAFIVFGTNFFVMTVHDGLMPHNFIFTLFAIMHYNTIKWYENPQLKNAIIIGLCIGLSVLIRPTSAVVILIPLLWNLRTFNDVKNRFSLFISKFAHLFLVGLAAFLIILPQLIYWKSVSGQWLFYSYPNEKIDLLKPYLEEVFFSFKKGWLIYTPLMCFAIWGFISLYKNKRELFYSVFIFFIFNAYLISCWECWWYGGSFAERPFVESYVFMAFPLASFINTVSLKRYYFILPLLFVGLFFIHLNLFQTHQANHGILHTSLTTKEYYKRIFLKNEATEEDKRWLEPTEYPDGKDELNPAIHYTSIYGAELSMDEYASQLNSANVFSPTLLTPTTLGYDATDNFVITTLVVDTNTANTSENVIAHLVTAIIKDGKLYKYRARDFNYSDIKNNKGSIQLSELIPPQVNDKNYEIRSYVYIDGDTKLKLISLKAKVFKVGQ